MEPFSHIRPVVVGWNCFAGDLELVADFLEQAIGEGVGVVTLEIAWQSEVCKDVGAKGANDSGRSHVFCRQQPDESTEAVSARQNVAVSLGLWVQLSEEVEIKYFHWLTCPCGIHDLLLRSQLVGY